MYSALDSPTDSVSAFAFLSSFDFSSSNANVALALMYVNKGPEGFDRKTYRIGTQIVPQNVKRGQVICQVSSKGFLSFRDSFGRFIYFIFLLILERCKMPNNS